jgi:hypothetical protein
MDHQIWFHQRRRKRKKREPRRFDGTDGQYNRAIRSDGEEFTLAINVDLESLDDSPKRMHADKCGNSEITPPTRQLFGPFVTGIRYVLEQRPKVRV